MDESEFAGQFNTLYEQVQFICLYFSCKWRMWGKKRVCDHTWYQGFFYSTTGMGDSL